MTPPPGAPPARTSANPLRRVLELVEPRISDRLVPDEGEFVVDEVRHHWAVYLPRVAEALLCLGLGALATVVPLVVAWIVLAAAVAVAVRAVAKALASYVDRFVITNLRVFRSWGLVSQQLATMPIQRILDISVVKPVLGRVLGYGHFVFESAADDQGLRDIRFVPRPFDRDLTMQRVIQRAGLRKGMEPGPRLDEDGPVPRGEPSPTVSSRGVPSPVVPPRRPGDRPPGDRPPGDRAPDDRPPDDRAPDDVLRAGGPGPYPRRLPRPPGPGQA